MLIGYARTSTVEQVAGFEAQVRELKATGAKKIFREQISSAASRAQLEAAIDYCREGDTLVVTKLDRLARSVRDLCRIIDELKAKDAGLRILNMNFDTASPTGKMMLTILGSIAEFEREIMLERQREGIAKAHSEGKYKGRAPTARAKADTGSTAAKASNVGRPENKCTTARSAAAGPARWRARQIMEGR